MTVAIAASTLDNIRQLAGQAAEIDALILKALRSGHTHQIDVLLRAKRALCQQLFAAARGLVAGGDEPLGDQVLEVLGSLQASHEQMTASLAEATDAMRRQLAAARKQRAAADRYAASASQPRLRAA